MVVSACAGETTLPADPGYRSVGVQDEAALGLTATGMMAAIGCTPVSGLPDTATVALTLLPELVRMYRCAGVDRDTVLVTAQAVQEMVMANPAWASAQAAEGDGEGGSPYWAYSHMECIWHAAAPPAYGTRPGAPGELPTVYVLVEAQPGYCAWMAIFQYVMPGTGGGGGWPVGDGPGGPGTGSPFIPPTVPSESVLDFIQIMDEEIELDSDTLPNCALPQDNRGRRAWCAGREPSSGTEVDRVRAAIQRMRSIGGECVPMANALDAVLAGGRLRFTSTDSISGWAPLYMGGDAPIVIHEKFLTRWYSASRKAVYGDLYMTLQLMLAHEISHALGDSVHIDPPRNLLTSKTLMCSDVPEQQVPQ